MTVNLTYDTQLSRVRVTATTYLNANPFFETNATNWTPIGGTFVRSTAQAHEGTAAGLLTPSGVASDVIVESDHVTGITAGMTMRVAGWVRCAVSRNVDIHILWFDASNVQFAAVGVSVPVAANTWTLASTTQTAPANTARAAVRFRMTGTPPASNTLHIDQAMLEPSPILVERSTDQIRWTTVRGGANVTPGVGSVAVDDYEFTADVSNTYRVSGQTSSITPTLDAVWVKSIGRPFLNRPVTVADFSEVSRRARRGVFDVVGRSFPVAVSDVRGSREWVLTLSAATTAEATELDLVLASGDSLFIHVPGTGQLSQVPGGYVSIGDTAESRRAPNSQRRFFDLSCTAVAAPAADVVGATYTYAGVANDYATYADEAADNATYADLAEHIGDVADVIVP